MSYFLRLKRRSRVPAPLHDTETIFAASDGTLKHQAPDGTVSNLGAGGVGDSPVSVASQQVNATEMTDLVTNPKTIVESPGSGKVLLPLGWLMQLSYGGIPFSATDSFVYLAWGAANASASLYVSEGVWEQTVDMLVYGPPKPGSGLDTTSPVAANNGAAGLTDVPLTLANDGADLTDGAGNSVTITVWYATVSLT